MAIDRIHQLMAFLEKDPTDRFTLYSIAYEYLKREKLEEAENFFKKLKNIDPLYIGLYYHLGKIYQQKEQWDEAISTFEEGIDVANQISDNHALDELKRAIQQVNDEQLY
ncbi:MAG: tetratricopeptide repeat protein [Bacteroidota bacterium]